MAYRLPLGQFDAAIAGMREAIELDPLSTFLNADLASALFFARRYKEALAQAESVLELGPGFQLAHMYRGMALSQLGRMEEAARSFQRGLDIAAQGAWLVGWAGHCFARAGYPDRAEAVRRMLDERRASGQYVTPLDYASIALGLGDIDCAQTHLDQAAEERTGLLIWAAVEPRFDELRGHPRFEALLDRINLRR